MIPESILKLIVAELEGRIQPEEIQQLLEWEQANPDLSGEADRIRNLWDQADGFQPQVSLDVDSDFEKVLSKINEQATRSEAKRFSIAPLLRVAAVAVVLLGAVYLIQDNFFSSPEMIQIQANANSTEALSLPDGTTVWLREGSSIAYAEGMAGQRRKVSLEGEAFFDVVRDEKRPFEIATPEGGKVEVLGTSFSVCSAEGHTEVLVKTGKVLYTPYAERKGVFLTPGRRAQFEHSTRQLHLENALSFNSLAWQAGGLEFINTPMHQVVKDLNDHYGTKVVLKNKRLNDCGFTSPLTDQPIESVLKSISLAFGSVVEPTATGYRIVGGNCAQ